MEPARGGVLRSPRELRMTLEVLVMIPWGASVRVQWRDNVGRRRGFWIWVPLFLVWLVLLPLLLILFPVVALVCVFVRLNAVRLYGTAWGIVSSLRKTLVEVDTPEVRVWVNLG